MYMLCGKNIIYERNGSIMRKSFMCNTAPVLTGAVQEENAELAIRAIKNFVLRGAKGIDLHLTQFDEESLKPETLKRIISESPLPIFGLNYSLTNNAEEENERIGLLLRTIEAGAAGIDIQGYTYDFSSRDKFNENFSNISYSFVKSKPKEVVVDNCVIEKQCELIERVHHMGGEILLSNHVGVFLDSQAIIDLCVFLEKRNPDTIKLVTMCGTEYELAETVKAMIMIRKEIKTPVTLICNGKYRAISRILNALLGGYMVFCVDTYTPKYAYMGQPDITAISEIIENADRLMTAIDGYGIKGGK